MTSSQQHKEPAATFTYLFPPLVSPKRGNISPDLAATRDDDGSLRCVCCGCVFRYESDLLIHQRRYTGERPFPCSRCFRSFVSGHALLLHRSSVHGDRSQFRCNFCGHSFGDGSTYSAHLEKHRIAGAIYQCSCSRVLRSDAELRHHLKAHDTGTGHRCSLCGRLYECRASLKIHVAKHKARKKLSLPKPPQSPSGSG